jgi:hypothetical protein
MSNEIKSNDGMSVVVTRSGDPGRTLFSDRPNAGGGVFYEQPVEDAADIARRNFEIAKRYVADRAAKLKRDEQA